MAKRDAQIRLSVEDMASGALARINSNFRQMAMGVASGQAIYNAAAAGLGKLAQAARESFSAIMEAEEAQARLNSALRSAGVVTQQSQRAIADFAGELGFQLGKSDEAIGQMAATAVRMTGLTGEGLQRLIRDAYDLAAAFGVDVDSAFRNLAKGINGNLTPLNKMGVQLDEIRLKAAKTAETFQKELLTQIEKLAGGAALDQAQTMRAALDRLTEGWGNFLEQAGAGGLRLTKLLNEAAIGYQNMAAGIQKAREEQGGFNKNLAEFQRMSGAYKGGFDEGWFVNAKREKLMAPYLQQARETQREIQKAFGSNSGNFLKSMLGSEFAGKTLEQFVLSMFSDKSIAELGPKIKDRLDEVFGLIEAYLMDERKKLFGLDGENPVAPVVEVLKKDFSDLEERARQAAEAIEERERAISSLFTETRSALMSVAEARAGWWRTAVEARVGLLQETNPFAAEKVRALLAYADGLKTVNARMKQYQEILAMMSEFDVTKSKKKSAGGGPTWALPGLEDALERGRKDDADPRQSSKDFWQNLRRASDEMSYVENVFADIAGQSIPAITNGITDALLDMKNFGDHLKEIFESILRIVIETLVKIAVIKGATALFGGGFFNQGGWVRRASTGLVVGPDITHDAVPILATPGEMVVNRATAERMYGRGQRGAAAAQGGGINARVQFVSSEQMFREFMRRMEDWAVRRGGRVYATRMVGR